MAPVVSCVPVETLIEVLLGHLPHSLPLYRRLQFPHKSENHRILATLLPQKTEDSTCFAAAYVERARYPRTECWMFLSCESKIDSSRSHAEESQCSNCVENCLSVVREIANIPTPLEDNSPEAIEANSKFPTHAFDPNLVLIGSLHSFAAHLLQDQGWISDVHPGLKVPYLKYIFESDSLSMSTINYNLPEDLRWGTVREQDFALVQTRTGVPRAPALLRTMSSIAIFPALRNSEYQKDVAPIAWGFLGVDGTLSAMHVEEEYRGRGLAKKVAANLIHNILPQMFDITGEPGGGLAHADVAPENDSSRGVCESVGGKNPTGWVVYWVRVDLDKAREYAMN